jgi:hypothetical protein
MVWLDDQGYPQANRAEWSGDGAMFDRPRRARMEKLAGWRKHLLQRVAGAEGELRQQGLQGEIRTG